MGEGMPPFDEGESSETFAPQMMNQEALAEIAERWRTSVVEALRSRSPESEQLLNALVASWEGTVGESFGERIGHIQNIANLYREAGLLERAFHALEDAADMAFNERQDETLASLEAEMDALRREAGRA